MTLSMKILDRICFTVVVLVTLTAVYLVGSSWIRDQKQAVQENQAVAKQSKELSQIDNDLRNLRTALERRQANLQGIYERIPETEDIGVFLKQLDALVKKSEIGLISIEPLPSSKENGFTRIPIHLICEGSFIRIYSLLHDLERLKRAVVMEKMTIYRPATGMECRLELTASILKYEKDDGSSGIGSSANGYQKG